MVDCRNTRRHVRLLGIGGLIGLATVLLSASSALGATRYAAVGGTGPAATCPQANPCDLDTAVEDASVVDGDEVVVTPGTYGVTQLNVNDAINLHGQAGQPRPTVTASTLFGISLNDAATLRDMNMTSSAQGTIYVGAAGTTLERLNVGSTAGGSIVCWIGNSAIVRDTVCASNATNTSGLGANSGLLAGTYSITLRNVTAAGTLAGLSFNYGGSGVTVNVDAKSVIASGNTYDVAASASGGSVTATMAHSNYNQEFESGGGTVTNPGTGTGNQTALPLFVNAGAGDYHQLLASPTVDAGAIDGSSGTTDFEGDDRTIDSDGVCPDDSAPDIGADELFVAVPDCTPPETSITGGPTGTTNDNTPTFDLSSSEPGSTFECRVDDGAFAPCATPHTTAALADGPHTFEARATDGAANTDPTPASRSFSVQTSGAADTTAPETNITSAPKAKVKAKRKKVSVSFEFKANEAATFECALDGARFASCTSPFTAKVGKGKHIFAVRATDSAGNVDSSAANASFKVKKKHKRR